MDQNALELVAALGRRIAVERLGENYFATARPAASSGPIFGGQLVAQALLAAAATVDDQRMPHSLHAVFLRGGDAREPVIYMIERDTDGRTFSSRSVVARQNERLLFRMSVSFMVGEEGLPHQQVMPQVPAPEVLRNARDHAEANRANLPAAFFSEVDDRRVFDIRPEISRAETFEQPRPPIERHWLRMVAPLTNTSQLHHRAVLAYMSDLSLLSTTGLAHGIDWVSEGLQSTSLDHALWFHGDADVSEWLLYDQEGIWSGGGRCLNRGIFFDQSGRQVATASQEGLMRMRRS